MNYFKGVYAAPPTPVKSPYCINTKELSTHCHWLLSQRINGIVLFGTTGEGPSFSLQQRKHALDECIDAGINPKNIILVITATSVEDSIDLITHAAQKKCLGVLVMPPYYFPNITDEGVINFYRTVLKNVDSTIPALLYHYPKISGIPLNFNIITTLAHEFSQVVGLKDSEGNIELLKSVQQSLPKFEILIGNDHYIQEVLKLGEIGIISGIAGVFPEPYKNLDFEKINHILAKIKEIPTIAALKYLLFCKFGNCWEELMPPLAHLTTIQKNSLKELL